MSFASKVSRLNRTRSFLSFFTSHRQFIASQFGEDAIIEQLLRPTRSGTYVDVGANHPLEKSNTISLYARGWSGLAIDPNPAFADDFRRCRPADTFLTEGVSLRPAELVYHKFSLNVFNTFSNERARDLVNEGHQKIGETIVPCRPLEQIVSEHLQDRQIDVLNVDCEDLDLEVLQSLDFKKHRPTVILVEDLGRLGAFRDGGREGEISEFLRDFAYSPIAQMAWSAIFVANDWRCLFQRSPAFREENVQGGYLPLESAPGLQPLRS